MIFPPPRLVWVDWLLAFFRLRQLSICRRSAGRGLIDDFHDYRDAVTPEPWPFYTHTCRHCGKKFIT